MKTKICALFLGLFLTHSASAKTFDGYEVAGKVAEATYEQLTLLIEMTKDPIAEGRRALAIENLKTIADQTMNEEERKTAEEQYGLYSKIKEANALNQKGNLGELRSLARYYKAWAWALKSVN